MTLLLQGGLALDTRTGYWERYNNLTSGAMDHPVLVQAGWISRAVKRCIRLHSWQQAFELAPPQSARPDGSELCLAAL